VYLGEINRRFFNKSYCPAEKLYEGFLEVWNNSLFITDLSVMCPALSVSCWDIHTMFLELFLLPSSSDWLLLYWHRWLGQLFVLMVMAAAGLGGGGFFPVSRYRLCLGLLFWLLIPLICIIQNFKFPKNTVFFVNDFSSILLYSTFLILGMFCYCSLRYFYHFLLCFHYAWWFWIEQVLPYFSWG
jgi:hypothetical protein